MFIKNRQVNYRLPEPFRKVPRTFSKAYGTTRNPPQPSRKVRERTVKVRERLRKLRRRGTRAVLPTANSRSCKGRDRRCLSNFHYQCPLIKPCAMEVKRGFFSFTDRARTAAPARRTILWATNVRPLLMEAGLGFEQKSTPTACACLRA